MGVNSYRDLVVWQKAMDLVEQVYCVAAKFPRAEVYGLTAQLQRSAALFSSSLLLLLYFFFSFFGFAATSTLVTWTSTPSFGLSRWCSSSRFTRRFSCRR
jgi:hypothetical protein